MIDLMSHYTMAYEQTAVSEKNVQTKHFYNNLKAMSSYRKKTAISPSASHTTKSIFPPSQSSEKEIPIVSGKKEDQLKSPRDHVIQGRNLFLESCRKEKSQVTLNILVAGQSGTGKSIFVSALLNKKPIVRLYQGQISEFVQESIGMIECDDDIVNLNLYDVKGYQKSNQKEWFKEVRHFINNRFKMQIRRNKFAYLNKTLYSQIQDLLGDERIHLCLYFLSGPQAIDEDLKFMKKLSNMVNVIPIIARGDQYTKKEVLELKKQYDKMFSQYHVDIYDCLNINDEQFKTELKEGQFGKCSPFMIIASTTVFYDKNGKKIQGRQYPWGYCDLWNPEHSDFALLYKSLIGYYIYDLIKLTDFYQHSYVKRKSQQKQQNKFSFIKQILLNINQIFI